MRAAYHIAWVLLLTEVLVFQLDQSALFTRSPRTALRVRMQGGQVL